ncbi:stage III sporulation protein AA [Aciduricibacillus chroicocephali]|uniref:Stage III sporulation protein AA n=1 Tax=Aciduricibacillus chroicocephali TaxID=3054939 RepID=A0ABY9KV63_9BACI|nr:stage III sporulation protein AA [Bacillaceae bacterium 44XB]
MDEILRLFPESVKAILVRQIGERWNKLQEIRVRLGHPIELYFDDTFEWLQDERSDTGDCAYILNQLTEFSLYRLEEELQQGYITIRGGHRVGIAGTATVRSGCIQSLKHINFFNIRIAKEKIGAAQEILSYILTSDGTCRHTLIAGPPQSGKTTILRDLARLLANEADGMRARKLAIIDERSEIAASWNGCPQHDVGMRTDVLDAAPKAEGMLLMIRSMSPEIIIADEIGKVEDANAVKEAANAGVTLITSVHARSMDELKQRPVLSSLIEDRVFERIILLERNAVPGKIKSVLDTYGNPLRSWGGGSDVSLDRRNLSCRSSDMGRF